jgi:hypothetical protein
VDSTRLYARICRESIERPIVTRRKMKIAYAANMVS